MHSKLKLTLNTIKLLDDVVHPCAMHGHTPRHATHHGSMHNVGRENVILANALADKNDDGSNNNTLDVVGPPLRL